MTKGKPTATGEKYAQKKFQGQQKIKTKHLYQLDHEAFTKIKAEINKDWFSATSFFLVLYVSNMRFIKRLNTETKYASQVAQTLFLYVISLQKIVNVFIAQMFVSMTIDGKKNTKRSSYKWNKA